MTVRVRSGEAGRWVHLARVLVAVAPDGTGAEARGVETIRAYRDRLVLKLEGVRGAGGAGELRGRWVLAPADQLPELPPGRHFQAHLIGLQVRDRTCGRLLGRVSDVIGSSEQDVLVVERPGNAELLVPFVGEIVLEVDEERGRIDVALPPGFMDAVGSGEPA